MRTKKRRVEGDGRDGRGTAGLALLGVVAAGVAAWLGLARSGDERPLSAEAVSPAGVDAAAPVVDASVPLSAVADRLDACAGKGASGAPCSGVVYFWSSEMPLSGEGIVEIAAAARRLGVALDVVRSTELYPAAGLPNERLAALAEELIAAGATLHAPSIVVHRQGALDRSAILGYKTSDAYAALISARLAVEPAAAPPPTPERVAASAGAGTPEAAASAAISWKDFAAAGQPGAYFRWVPGRNAVAYEAGGRVYLLDLETGESRPAPGFVDFVPTPDGKLFVTPGRGALEFYDAEEVFEASRAGRGRNVRPIYSDPEMQDQYPSMGILSSTTQAGGTTTVYRVLTSWFSEVAFRDYEVRSGQGGTVVRPIGEPTVACRADGFSIPILAPSGREVAGRDEASATTKVFRLADDGGCQEAIDLRLPTGKVAWHVDNQRLAFAIPQGAVNDGSGVVFRGVGGQDRAGIFLFDRRDGSVTRIEGSVDARRLAFPEFVGPDQVMFVLPPEGSGGPGRFRLVCCLP